MGGHVMEWWHCKHTSHGSVGKACRQHSHAGFSFCWHGLLAHPSVGVGADEQMGGYARHRTRWRKHGMAGLKEEMQMDMVNMIIGGTVEKIDDVRTSESSKTHRVASIDE